MKKKRIKVVLPVYNEEKELKPHALKVKKFLEENLGNYLWKIIIVDNASTDKTPKIGQELGRRPTISYLRLEEKGRGRAVKRAWGAAGADIFVYMDIDLSTDLGCLPLLIKAIEDGFDIAIGSRLLPSSKVTDRTLKRELLSRGYNFLIKILFGVHFSDAQCGFKAVNKRVVDELLPRVLDNEWFFDSELLIMGENLGFKIYEEPVIWRDNPGSTVRLLPTISGDLKGIVRLFFRRR
jgi:glycosyltransferase involved in cell wall biosynthesis